MLTKTPGKRYAYRYNFHALKRACEAQQNPLPSDTKEDKLHAIMQTAISDEASVLSPASSDSREEFLLTSQSVNVIPVNYRWTEVEMKIIFSCLKSLSASVSL